MGTWLAAKQALTAMDRVTRGWAQDLGLDECGVMVVMLLGEHGPRAGSDLALLSGRLRQQVQRSLGALKLQGMVAPSLVSGSGRVHQWALTDRGRALWGILESAMKIWEEILSREAELPAVVLALQRMVEIMVNRPSADGWRLLVPDELRRDPIGCQAVRMAQAEDREAVRERARQKGEEEIARAWAALWR